MISIVEGPCRAHDGTPLVSLGVVEIGVVTYEVRTVDALPDEPAVHAAALTFATDMPMWEPGMFPHPVRWTEATSPFDAKPRYSVKAEDHVWYWLYLPITWLAEWLARIAGHIQQGRISVYLTYSFFTLIALLLFIQ